jgi:hypothetical protein
VRGKAAVLMNRTGGPAHWIASDWRLIGWCSLLVFYQEYHHLEHQGAAQHNRCQEGASITLSHPPATTEEICSQNNGQDVMERGVPGVR